MSVWPEPDAALVAFVGERQRIAISNYVNDPLLLQEHLGHEEDLASGGYGKRQIPELLQNAADALLSGGSAGRVEFRIAGGNLYCANEGAAFDERGVTALCYAFIASKRGDEIGRFGLGFKSVLALTDNPQVFSRTVSFQFNAPGSQSIFIDAGVEGDRFPVMRVPAVIDAHSEAASDPDLADLMTWASTIVKLPLARGGARVREELVNLPPNYLLFLDWVNELGIVLAGAEGQREPRRYLRQRDADDVTITNGDEVRRYAYASRMVRPSAQALAELPSTIARDEMLVSYAAPLDGKTAELGRLWAWFPLGDFTTARGAFNAPWHLIEDRTALVPGMSALNRELLEASAELFLEVAGRASTPDDPAAHFDLFPARGRETRSEADSFLSRRIPELASRRAFIPDADGALRVAEHFHGALDTDDDQVQPEGVRDWQESVSRSDVPHWRCYQTSTRRTRLRALLRATDDAGRGRSETTAAVWLRELAMVRDQKAILAALDILANVPRRAGSLPEIFSSPVIPLEGGGWARAAESSRVLLAEPGSVVPEGLPIVDRALSSVPEIRAVLRGLGFQGVSIDQTATALTAGIRSSWGEAEWERYWSALTSASPASGIRAMREAVDAGRAIKVRDRTGTWRTASSVFADQRIAAENDALHADPAIHRGRGDLLAAAGCLTGADSSADLSDDLVYTRWRSHVTSHLEARLAAQNARLLEIHWPTAVGTGPLSLLHDLQDDHQALTAWSAEIIRNLDTQKLSIGFTVSTGAKGATDVVSPALWALTEYGRVQTTLGSLPFAVALGPSMSGYGAFLPVMADFDLALALSLPKDLASAPDSAIEFAFRRSDYMLEADGLERLTETLLQAADRKKFTRSAKLPAVSPDGQIRIVGRSSVVLALSPDDALELRADGTSYLPCSKTAAARLADQWGLRTSEEVLRRALEIIEGAEEVPLLDVFPALPRLAGDADLSRYKVRSSPRIVRKIQGPNGMREKELLGIEQGDLLTIDESLDEIGVLSQVSQLLQLRLSDEEIHRVIDLGQQLRVNDLVGRVRAAGSDVEKILLLADAEQLGGLLPDGLLASVRQRKGAQSDREVAELYLTVRGYDALLMLKETMVGKGIQVPQQWAGSPEAQRLVASLGFATAFAGAKARNPLPVEHVLGKVELAPLHDFQEEIANGVRTIALERSTDGQAARALLNLPTGAGKTRVAVESIVRLLVSDELRGPVLWIAQSEELCEQAISSWMEVWRAVGDRRVMEISRFFGGRELDESIQDVHIVVATDDQLLARINSPQADMYGWLSEPGIVVIDEAHTAGSRGYTEILRWLGLTAARTDRPLIGLTATAYRGRNDETNRLFANRFGARRIDAPSLGDEPIAELRRREVLAEVDHRVLTGMNVPLDATADKEFFRLKEVTKSMLDRIGQDLDRTQMLVDDILKQDPDWPILVFAPSVVSAHTVAALLRLEGREDAAAVDGSMRMPERRRVIEKFKAGETRILVNCELLTQGFDAPKTRALYIARPTFSPNRYHQMIGRGLRGPRNGGKERCLIVNVEDTFDQFGERLAFTEFDHLWSAG